VGRSGRAAQSSMQVFGAARIDVAGTVSLSRTVVSAARAWMLARAKPRAAPSTSAAGAGRRQ